MSENGKVINVNTTVTGFVMEKGFLPPWVVLVIVANSRMEFDKNFDEIFLNCMDDCLQGFLLDYIKVSVTIASVKFSCMLNCNLF